MNILHLLRRKPEPRAIVRWGLLWRSYNRLDGTKTHIVMRDCQPVMFHTRQAARDYADRMFGYIDERPDLRAEPHGWAKPKPVRLTVSAAKQGWETRRAGL